MIDREEPMSMNHSSNVADLSDEQRRVLESVIGQPLANDQVVYWSIATPGRTPSAADRTRALAGLEATFAKVRRNLDEKGISQAEWEAAVDDAVQAVRSQRDQCGAS
jgi:hypothetical protein